MEITREYNTCVLEALQGIKCSQLDIRSGRTEAVGKLVKYYRILPQEIAKRLSEIAPEKINRIEAAPRSDATKTIARELSDDDAFSQVIRAVNVFRTRLGLQLLGPDGWPEKGDGTSG